MWQRIQTLYLSVATLLLAAMFFLKFATIYAPDGKEPVMYYEMIPTALLIFSALSASGVAVFAYRNRPLQLRLASTSALVNLALEVYLLYHFFRADDAMVFSLTMAFPAIAAILDYLAFRAIASDEIAISTAIRMKKIKAKERKREKRKKHL